MSWCEGISSGGCQAWSTALGLGPSPYRFAGSNPAPAPSNMKQKYFFLGGIRPFISMSSPGVCKSSSCGSFLPPEPGFAFCAVCLLKLTDGMPEKENQRFKEKKRQLNLNWERAMKKKSKTSGRMGQKHCLSGRTYCFYCARLFVC